MTPGLRTHRSASLRVAIAEGLPEDMREETRELLSVCSTNPRKGHATALMHEVCTEADLSGISLLAAVRPFDDGAMTGEQLEKWYRRFDFELIQDEPPLMLRSPQRPRIVVAQ